MHQFIEATIGKEVKIFDNIHPKGMLKADYIKEIGGSIPSTHQCVSGEELLNKFTK